MTPHLGTSGHKNPSATNGKVFRCRSTTTLITMSEETSRRRRRRMIPCFPDPLQRGSYLGRTPTPVQAEERLRRPKTSAHQGPDAVLTDPRNARQRHEHSQTGLRVRGLTRSNPMQSNRRKVLQVGLGSTAAALFGIAAWQSTPFLPASSLSHAVAKPRSKQPKPDGGNGKPSGATHGRHSGKSQTDSVGQETAHQHAPHGHDVRAGKWLVKGKEIAEENGKLFVHNLLPFEAFDSEQDLAKRVEQGAADNLFKLPLASSAGSATTESDSAVVSDTAEPSQTEESESAARNPKRKRKNKTTEDPSTAESEAVPRDSNDGSSTKEPAPRHPKRKRKKKQ